MTVQKKINARIDVSIFGEICINMMVPPIRNQYSPPQFPYDKGMCWTPINMGYSYNYVYMRNSCLDKSDIIIIKRASYLL